ncbi:hypothetical protein PanWU01x14_213190 [Parasponia andersonii]|uniref:von Willebrand factor, type A n=1 Tax=Parasponia andersonii TaxID=3476 RepID=A0A2P5BSY2_PARAD|nr:hypothetical protein PanWU01x14_213190 [Parasponia andersonii]
MAPPSLLGPPELYNSTPALESQAGIVTGAGAGDRFVDLLVANFNKTYLPERLPLGFTENRSPTFLTSGNPCLDFFFHVVPDTPSESLTERLCLAWAHDPLTTLKLVCNLRGVRGTGKSDKEGLYTAAFWLHRYHPKTLASNVGSLADFGYFKDLPEILYRLLEGPDVRRVQKAEWQQRKGVQSRYRRGAGFRILGRKTKPKQSRRRIKSTVPREIRVLKEAERAKKEKERARVSREEKRIAMAKKVVDRYIRDKDFQFLYEKVSDHFAECLKADMECLNHKDKPNKISLAAKWCPSLDSSFDRSTLLCESIAKKVFPRESYPEYQGIEEAHYAYRVRDRLRKQVLVPLRKALELPEVYIGANQWNAIPYNRVASVAMRFYKDKFLKHDGERFGKYLEDVKQGKSKIAAGALLPHEIIESLYGGDDGGQVAELQWKRMVEDLSKEGKLKNCLAVSDVSGSMSGTPMEVSVALGLLVSELSEEPWKGKIITFSEFPQLHLIEGDDLESKIKFVRRMEWGMNTDFQKVFDLILQVAVNGNLKEEEMVKRVFVFSDMEFDQASLNSWETDYEAITRKFKEKGYGKAVPDIVFWNLRNSMSTPVMGTQKGVALVSGFSKNLMKLFLDNNGEIDPERVMEAAISGDEYQSLVVVD